MPVPVPHPSLSYPSEVATSKRLDPGPLRACLVAVVLAALFAFLFVAPSHEPAPNDLPVAVVGPEAAAAQLERRGGAFDVLRVSGTQAARDAVLERKAYGALVVTGSKAPELLIATAASPTVAGILKEVAAGASGGAPMRTTELRPLDPDDPRGTTINATTLSVMAVAAVLSAVLLFTMAPALGGAARLAVLALMAALGGLTTMAVVSLGLGALPGSYLALSGVVALGMLAASSVSAAIIARLGMPGIGLSFVLFLAIATPATGAASAPHLLPDPWATLGQLLPPGAAATALRDVAYFDGALLGAWLPVLLGWAGLGAGLLLLGGRRRAASAVPVASEARTQRPSPSVA